MRPSAVSSIALALLLVPSVIMAQTTDTTTFGVTATVAAQCTITAEDLAFGAYDPAAGDHEGTTTVTVTCTSGTDYSIGLGPGANPGAVEMTSRSMEGDGDFLGYDLYQEADRTTVWGDTEGVDRLPGAGTGTSQQHTVYGEIPGGQFVTPASYSDTVTATVFF